MAELFGLIFALIGSWLIFLLIKSHFRKKNIEVKIKERMDDFLDKVEKLESAKYEKRLNEEAVNSTIRKLKGIFFYRTHDPDYYIPGLNSANFHIAEKAIEENRNLQSKIESHNYDVFNELQKIFKKYRSKINLEEFYFLLQNHNEIMKREFDFEEKYIRLADKCFFDFSSLKEEDNKYLQSLLDELKKGEQLISKNINDITKFIENEIR